MYAHYFQHAPFEGLGSIAHWLQQQQACIGVTRFYAGDALPNPARVDFLIVMGGPMSVNNEDAYPWLNLEKRFIRDFIASGKPVLGICLGAQLIASALGAAVYPGEQKEIGWWPLTRADDVPDNAVSFPDAISVFHWHGETFDLPQGAIHLASSSACRNQAFQVGNKVIGLQFHLETTPASTDDIIEHCRAELVDAPYIQSEHEIFTATAEQYLGIHQQMNRILEYLTTSS